MSNLPTGCTGAQVDSFFASDSEMHERGAALAVIETVGNFKAEMFAVINRYCDIMDKSTAEANHAKDCIGDMVSDLFGAELKKAREII